MKKNALIDEIIEKIESGEDLTSFEKRTFILYAMTVDHEGKMAGKVSINTSCACNDCCIARQNNPSLVCWLCYADNTLCARTSLKEKLRISTIFYTKYMLTKADIPFLNWQDVRFEAFGDVNNVTHVNNYITIANANKDTYFVLWTKNIKIVKKALKGKKLPDNMRIIYSVPKINFKADREFYQRIKKLYPFVSKIFCVFTADYAKENNVKVNCAGQDCSKCNKCYSKQDRTILINEVLRGKQRIIKRRHNKEGVTQITCGMYSYWKHDGYIWDIVLMDVNNRPYGNIIKKDVSFTDVLEHITCNYCDPLHMVSDFRYLAEKGSKAEKEAIKKSIKRK